MAKLDGFTSLQTNKISCQQILHAILFIFNQKQFYSSVCKQNLFAVDLAKATRWVKMQLQLRLLS